MADTTVVQPPKGVARTLQSHTLYGNIFAHCSPRSLLRFRRVSRAAQQAVQDYMDRAFNVNKRLSRYFRDPLAFRSLQARTAAIVSGSFALQFFDRTYYPESDLDIYTHPERSLLDVGLYLQSEGYTFEPYSWQQGRWRDEVDQLCTRMNAHVDALENEDEVSELYDMKGTRAVYTFVRDPTPGAPAATTRKVQIIVARSTPLRALLDFHSSIVLNIITYNAAYCLYPLATLEAYTSLVLNGGNPGKVAALEKYAKRGWRAISNPSPLIQYLNPSLFYVGKSRWVCDEHTWTVPLSMEGVKPPPPSSPSSEALSWDPIAECGWRLAYLSIPEGLVIAKFGIVATTVLRWGYTTGNAGYLGRLVSFFMSQGRLEHRKKPDEDSRVEDCTDVWTWWVICHDLDLHLLIKCDA
ncbi:hypothetical protein C8Q70DRAFT_916411 [Cubamyces menziesii]|nr:hypothetical protein C8Q70DRAFT_916411 [Cubamyces menziesii]